MHWHDTEHPSIRAFALAPGMIPTRLAAETRASGSGGGDGDGDAELKKVAPDSVALPAATMLYLTSGRADWLSGRFAPLARLLFHIHLSHLFFMGLLDSVPRTGTWRRWSGIGRM
jgi:hypothetical protein